VQYATLNRRHSVSDAKTFARLDALYRGGRAFRCKVGDFLPQNPLESSQVYELRKRECAYVSYVGPMVDFFAAQLFGAPFLVRANVGGLPVDADPFYARFKESVDRKGTDLADFLKARFVTALVCGVAWWSAEFPDDGGTPASDREEWAGRGHGDATLRAIDPSDVLDWETDDDGLLTWALTHARETRRDDPRAERLGVTETWRLWDSTSVETFQVTYDPKKPPKAADDVPSMGTKVHRFPRLPLVCMRLPDGLWLLNRTAEGQEEHFRLSAAESWATKRACYPMGVFKSEDREKPPVTGAGLVTVIGVKEELLYVSPSTAPFEVLGRQIEARRTELYRVAQQMAASVDNSAATAGRSGESKEADNAATEVCLHAYASVVKAACEETYELVSDGREDFDLTFSIEGMTKFSPNGIAAALGNLKTALDLGIPSPTLTRELRCKAVDLVAPDLDEATKDAIREEIRSASAKAPPAPPKPEGDPAPLEGAPITNG
jgi:hypothetical protein